MSQARILGISVHDMSLYIAMVTIIVCFLNVWITSGIVMESQLSIITIETTEEYKEFLRNSKVPDFSTTINLLTIIFAGFLICANSCRTSFYYWVFLLVELFQIASSMFTLVVVLAISGQNFGKTRSTPNSVIFYLSILIMSRRRKIEGEETPVMPFIFEMTFGKAPPAYSA
ncbi:hypothetical protein M3Y96_00604600 [Aphelenchoides besseyi]|nr:hypothetical protein M3Y96_00604600 [Aphelenchoides besseyi]